MFEGKEYFIKIFSISVIDALPFSDHFIDLRYNVVSFSAAQQGTAVCQKNLHFMIFLQAVYQMRTQLEKISYYYAAQQCSAIWHNEL